MYEKWISHNFHPQIVEWKVCEVHDHWFSQCYFTLWNTEVLQDTNPALKLSAMMQKSWSSWAVQTIDIDKACCLPQQNKVKRKTKETVQLTNETNKEEEWMRGDYLKSETLVIKKNLSIAFQSLENIFVVFFIYKGGIIDLIRQQQRLALQQILQQLKAWSHYKCSRNGWSAIHGQKTQFYKIMNVLLFRTSSLKNDCIKSVKGGLPKLILLVPDKFQCSLLVM